jgi:hypothetical protein
LAAKKRKKRRNLDLYHGSTEERKRGKEEELRVES